MLDVEQNDLTGMGISRLWSIERPILCGWDDEDFQFFNKVWYSIQMEFPSPTSMAQKRSKGCSWRKKAWMPINNLMSDYALFSLRPHSILWGAALTLAVIHSEKPIIQASFYDCLECIRYDATLWRWLWRQSELTNWPRRESLSYTPPSFSFFSFFFFFLFFFLFFFSSSLCRRFKQATFVLHVLLMTKRLIFSAP